ncbi:MAG: P-loop NTPase fold protein, partial [Actinomycetota bacterium]|nr:P-loop NTPase fold protein [Actinomycetota bacterium]
GEQVGDPITGHILWVRALALTSDDSQIITGGADGTVRIWDRGTGEQVGDPITGHTARVLALAVTCDDSQIITASGDGTVRIWDRGTGEQVGETFTGLTGRVFAVAVTSDDAQVITGGDDGTVRIWGRASGEQVGAPLTGHTSRVLAVAVTSDDSQIITASGDGTVRIWDRASGEQVGDPLTGHTGQVCAVAVTSGDIQIITGGENGTIRIWDRASGKQVGAPLTGHTGFVFAVAVTSNDSQIITASDDGTVRIWDRARGHQVGGPLTGHTARVRALAVTSDGTQIITGGEDGTIRIWDRASGRQVAGTEFSTAPPVLADPHSGVVSDAESATDQLGVTRDVNSVAALLAALGTAPPLSVALLGDWGSGKSSFMQQVISRVDMLADASKRNPRASAYAAHVRQVRFNAWHYSDDLLWVGLVEHLFRELADRRRDPTEDGQRAVKEAELASEQFKCKQLSKDLRTVDQEGDNQHWFGWLNKLSRAGLVLRLANRSVWAEIRTSRNLLLSVVLLLLCVGLIVAFSVSGEAVAGWVTGGFVVVATLLRGVVLVWQHMDRFIEQARNKLQSQKAASEAQIEDLADQLDRIDPARRLKNLLSEISSPERYESYRGLTGRIRQDLDRISDELAAARDDWAKGKSGTAPPLQRIILYIDDLDRCPAARVVQVLQAVNLLLSMSLFIVVVAVDPRWLLGALEDQHGKELGVDQRRERSLNFLDKIFHIAYAVRPMGDRATEYLRSLLPPVEDTDVGDIEVRDINVGDTEPAREEGQQAGPRLQPPDMQTEGSRVESDQNTDLGSEAPTVRRRRPSSIDLTDRGLRLRSAEYDFLPHLAPLLLTPRAIKKLTNLYRLLRISVADDQLDDFVGDEDGGPYQAAALLLAAVISAPAQAESFLADLATAKPGADIVDTLTSLSDSALAASLAKRIREIREVLPVHGDVTTYQRCAVSVPRYSLETYRLFSGKSPYSD